MKYGKYGFKVGVGILWSGTQGKYMEDKTFTQEEVDALIEEKTTEANDKIGDLETQIEEAKDEDKEDLKTKLEEANTELKGLKDKETNFKKLRTSKEKVNGELEDTKKEFNDKIDVLVQQNRKDAIDDFKTGKEMTDDKELNKKFDFYFEKLGSEAKTKVEIKIAAEEAYSLSTREIRENDTVKGVAPRHASYKHKTDTNETESEDSKGMRKGLKISDEDRKKYGGGKEFPLIKKPEAKKE